MAPKNKSAELAKLVLAGKHELPRGKERDLAARLQKLAGKPVERDSRTCFGIEWYDSELKANFRHLSVRLYGETYNGGWFHGMACGREKSFDYTRDYSTLYAVTIA